MPDVGVVLFISRRKRGHPKRKARGLASLLAFMPNTSARRRSRFIVLRTDGECGTPGIATGKT